MPRRLLRFVLTGALLLAVALLVRRTVHLRDELEDVVPSPDPWPPIAEATAADIAITEPPTPAWLNPVDGACPSSHPIKAKAASGIYHLPGMANYERTKPDRCYAEVSAAESDGFTKAKR